MQLLLLIWRPTLSNLISIILLKHLRELIQRFLKAGLVCGVLIAALGFANVSDLARPPDFLTVLAPFGEDLLVLGIVISVLTGAGLLVIKLLSRTTCNE